MGKAILNGYWDRDVFECATMVVAAFSITQKMAKPSGLTSQVNRFGLAVRRYPGKQNDLGLSPLRLSFLFTNCL